MDNKLLGLILSGDKKLAKEVAVERARITALATLPEGSTTGDAELMDARVDVNGTVHDNVGEHIRAIETELEEGLGGGSGVAEVTAESITEALGYTPADVADVTQLKSDFMEFTVEGEVPINICNEVYEYGRFDTDGSYVDNGKNHCFRTSSYLKVEGGKTIIGFFGQNNFSGGAAIQLMQYDSDKEVIGTKTNFYVKKYNGKVTGDAQQPKELTLNDETAYIRFSVCPWDDVGALENLEVGLYYVEDNVEDYLPYSATKTEMFLNSEKIKGLGAESRKMFSNVESMVGTFDLVDGDVCETYGYFNNGDGGGAVYIIVSELDATTYQISLTNGLYASLIHDGTINVKCLGAVCEPNTDNQAVFQKAFDIATKAVIIPSGLYQLKNPVNISGKNNFAIYAQDSVINYWGSGTYAFRFTNISQCNFYFGGISCWNNGCGIEIYSEDYNNPVQYINFTFNVIKSDVNCFYLHAHEGVSMGQVTEVRFFNGRVQGYTETSGIGFKLITTGGAMDHFVFSSIGIEGVDTGFYLEGLQEEHPLGAIGTYCRIVDITNCRMLEALNKIIETVGCVSHVKIDTSCYMRSDYFKFSELTTECFINGSICDPGYGSVSWLLFVRDGIVIPQSYVEQELVGETWYFDNSDKFTVPSMMIIPETMKTVVLTNQYGVLKYGINDIRLKFNGVHPEFKLLDHTGNVIFNNVSAINSGDTLRFKWGEYSGWTVEKLNTIALTV